MNEPIARILRDHIAASYLAHTGRPALRDDQDLFDTGVLDSASALALLFFVEERFAISVPNEDFLPENFASIAAATGYIAGRLGDATAAPRAGEGGS